MAKKFKTQQVRIQKLVNGGQGLAELDSGKKILVWGALPGELVLVKITKNKKSYAIGFVEQIIEPATERIEPQEHNYLSTSPWQIIDFASENRWKELITKELFEGQKIDIDFSPIETDGVIAHYRNKMEYSFWGNDDGLHLALHRRGTNGKEIVQGSLLAMKSLDKSAQDIVAQLQANNVFAGDLKSLIVRTSQDGRSVSALFVRIKKFPKISLPETVSGMVVYYSEPKSPASVPTKLLYKLGDTLLSDEICGKKLEYDVMSFFQVNVAMANKAISKIKELTDGTSSIVDLYSGVGTIGLSIGRATTLVESDLFSYSLAVKNAKNGDVVVVNEPVEKALQHIKHDVVIVDPPRSGLHTKLIDKLLEVRPKQIVYMSCNPATQARDIALLKSVYNIDGAFLYNFFPRTPHIETIINLKLR